MKIIDLATTAQGAYRLLRTRVKKINTSGMENIILCPGDNSFHVFPDSDKFVRYIRISRGLGLFSTLSEIIKIGRFLREYRPDVLHTHNSKAGAVGRIAAFVYRITGFRSIKIIHQVHGYYFNTLSGLKRFVFILAEFFLCLFTDILLFQNMYELGQSKKVGMGMLTRMQYLGNGINFEEFGTPPLPPPVRKKENLIICVARIERVKNHLMIVRGLDYLQKELGFDDFTCCFIGEGTDRNIMDQIRKSRISAKIELKGVMSRKEITDCLKRARLSVLTSRKEGMPRSIMEAMYFGIPCVGTDVIGTNELISDNKNGFLVPLNDHRAFAERLKKLLTDEELYRRFSENAREYSLNNFNEDGIIEKLIDIYSG